MELELLIHNNINNKDWDISNIAQKITVKKSIDGNAGQMTCILQKDPTQNIKSIDDVGNGSFITFKVNKIGIFAGYVFKIGTDAEENYKLTCYDSLRYLKNVDIYTFRTETASQIFEKICKDYDLKYKIETPISYIPTPYQFLNKSLYQIIQRGLNYAIINNHKHYYYIIDDFGVLKLSDLAYEGNNLSIQLGDASLVNSFTLEKSIDKDTYNQIKLYREDKDTGNVKTWIVNAPEDIAKWGVLQLFQKAEDNSNLAQITSTAKNLLTVKDRETYTLKLQAEGIIECVAGKRLRFLYTKEGIDKWMWIKSSTHNFTKYEHTMDLEMEVGF